MPHAFILDGLFPLEVRVKKMFGNYAIYVEDKIFLATRHHIHKPIDNGIWIGTSHQHHESLKKEFPSITNLRLYNIKKWLLLPEESDTFESTALHICDAIKSGDPRFGV